MVAKVTILYLASLLPDSATKSNQTSGNWCIYTAVCFAIKRVGERIRRKPLQYVVFLATRVYTARFCCCCCCTMLPTPNTSSLPSQLYCLPVCSLGSLPGFISSMTTPLSKCQVTLRAKEEHYTAAPCHAGRDITHTQVLISLLFTAGHRSAHSPVCMCEESKKKNTLWVFFPSFSKPAKRLPTAYQFLAHAKAAFHCEKFKTEKNKKNNKKNNKQNNLETQLAKQLHINCILDNHCDLRCCDSGSSAPFLSFGGTSGIFNEIVHTKNKNKKQTQVCIILIRNSRDPNWT